jgi:hypothetical protein
MLASRPQQATMNSKCSDKGGIVSVKRLLTGIVAACVLSLALTAGSASARTAYEYVYSGEYIDGSSTFQPFGAELGGLDYDPATGTLYVAHGGSTHGYVQKYSLTGVPQDFSGLGSPTAFLSLAGTDNIGGNAEIAVDKSGSTANGQIYVEGNNRETALNPDGTENLNFTDLGFLEELCGVTVNSSGEVIYASRTYETYFDSEGKQLKMDFMGRAGLEPGTKLKWGERDHLCALQSDSQGNLYGYRSNSGNYRPIKIQPDLREAYELSQQMGQPNALAIDSSDDNPFVIENNGSEYWFTQYDTDGAVLGTKFGLADPGHSYLGLQEAKGIAVDPVTHDVYVANKREYAGGVRHIEKFIPVAVGTVPDVRSIQPAYPSAHGETMTLRGVINPDGVETTDCHFEYGTTQALGTTVPCDQGNGLTGSGDVTVTATVPTTVGVGWYFYRVSAKNSNGLVQRSGPMRFVPQGKPVLGFFTGAERVNTDGLMFRTEFEPNGGNASYHFEYGTNGEFQYSTPESHTFGWNSENGNFSGSDNYEPGIYDETALVSGLTPGETYEWRAVITNEAGSVESPVQKVTTYRKDPGSDACSNAHVRQQTESSLLLDCRAYELVSAANAGGYDVESDIVPGQEPLDAYPRANDSVLYSMHFGVIPGISGSPTNLGRDPYIATRTATGWTTRYVGLPADGMADPGKFGSPLLEADPGLHQFAFGGPEICSPCFSDGSTNVPLRLSSGSLVKGMAGSLAPAVDPAGFVGTRFSADGSHFVFGAEKQFETAGRSGQVSIYDRNLQTGATQVVSTLPSGQTMSEAVGPAGELGISSSGSRIVVGEEVSTDAAGNHYWHPYMHLGNAAASVDLAPGTTSGVLYAGMSADGSRVFFVTPDSLLGADSDTSADLYEAAVNAAGSVTLRLLSDGASGSVGQLDTCDPAGNELGNNWNAVGGSSSDSCGVVAIAGGGGVAASGTVYFFSPEALDGEGTTDQPNLFVVQPGGQPQFVTTLEAANPAIVHGVTDNEVHRFGDFQVAPNGRYAVFNTHLQLSESLNLGFSDIYRYDAAEKALDCVSCSPTGAAQNSDIALQQHGLNLTDDGRVFYTTSESFALRDTNQKKDAYEWSNGAYQLVSTGIGPQDSGLVTVSPDGKNAYFFTREVLVPTDQNGNTVKIYDAREGGGFPYDPPRLACAASDECHGPSSPIPPPPDLATYTGAGHRAAQAEEGSSCKGFANRARKDRALARRLRHKAATATSAKRARHLRHRAGRFAKKAKQLSTQAKTCRRSSGGKGR